MKVVPYLYTNGRAMEALDFYTRVFKTPAPQIMKYKEQPGGNVPAEFGDKVLHAEFSVDGNAFYLSDAVGENEVRIGNNVQINLNFDSEEELRRIYAGLSEGGNIRYPLEETFWGAIFAMVTDKFDISWSLNYQKPGTSTGMGM